MHLEILIEDESGRIAVESFVEKVLGRNGEPHTYRFHSYKGLGHIPRNLRGTTDPAKRVLLDRLPKILAGYGKSLKHQGDAAVVVVVDLDNRDCHQLKNELLSTLKGCDPRPRALFRIAIEETEAWLLGDQAAVLGAYPETRRDVLESYIQDSICNTWETLADAIFPGGSKSLRELGYPHIGRVKCEWAERIGAGVDVASNRSKSFQVFCRGLLELVRD